MRRWLAHRRLAITTAARRAARAPLSLLAQALIIGMAVALPLLLHLTVQNVGRAAGQSGADPRITLFLAAGSDAPAAQAIADRLAAHPAVASHRHVPRDEALAELRERHGLPDIADLLPGNPLPDAFSVRARDLDPAALESLRAEAAAWPGVAEALLDSAWARQLQAALAFARALAIGLSALLALVLVASAFAVCALQAARDREEIAVSRLLGASPAFVRRPFVYLALAVGAAGGTLALGLAALCLRAADVPLRALVVLYGGEFSLAGPTPLEAAAVVGGCALLAALGSWLAASAHLRRADRAAA
jgi:cell division transport system permease protein